MDSKIAVLMSLVVSTINCAAIATYAGRCIACIQNGGVYCVGTTFNNQCRTANNDCGASGNNRVGSIDVQMNEGTAVQCLDYDLTELNDLEQWTDIKIDESYIQTEDGPKDKTYSFVADLDGGAEIRITNDLEGDAYWYWHIPTDPDAIIFSYDSAADPTYSIVTF